MQADDIKQTTFDYSCSIYLKEDEDKSAMLKKFNEDKDALMNFLRDRGYKEWIKTNKKPADTSEIQDRINKLIERNKKDNDDKALLDAEKKEAPALSANKIESPAPTPAPSVIQPPAAPIKPEKHKNRTWSKKKKTNESSSDSNQSSLF